MIAVTLSYGSGSRDTEVLSGYGAILLRWSWFQSEGANSDCYPRSRPEARSLIVYCADIGSVKRGNFGWARAQVDAPEQMLFGVSPDDLATHVAADLSAGSNVALGFECPLYIPLRESVEEMMLARAGEGNRAWSAGAGLAVLTLGAIQVPWILTRVASRAGRKVRGFVEWLHFDAARAGLFVWEAFVTGDAKYSGSENIHGEDAAIAVRTFFDSLPDPRASHALEDEEVYSLAGAALLRAGLCEDPGILSVPTLVLRAKPRVDS